jgi:hypothetical protein
VHRRDVVDRNLLASPNVAQRENEQLGAEGLQKAVRPARVVDVVRAVAAARAVDAPPVVEPADAQDSTAPSPFGFGVGDSLAGVLGDLLPPREARGRKAAATVDRGSRDVEPGRELQCGISSSSSPK